MTPYMAAHFVTAPVTTLLHPRYIFAALGAKCNDPCNDPRYTFWPCFTL